MAVTTHYDLTKPVAGSSGNATDLNANLDTIDATMYSNATASTANTGNIATNTSDISDAEADISTNTSGIATNVTNIATNTTAINQLSQTVNQFANALTYREDWVADGSDKVISGDTIRSQFTSNTDYHPDFRAVIQVWNKAGMATQYQQVNVPADVLVLSQAVTGLTTHEIDDITIKASSLVSGSACYATVIFFMMYYHSGT